MPVLHRLGLHVKDILLWMAVEPGVPLKDAALVVTLSMVLMQCVCKLPKDLLEAVIKPGHQLSPEVLKLLFYDCLGEVC